MLWFHLYNGIFINIGFTMCGQLCTPPLGKCADERSAYTHTHTHRFSSVESDIRIRFKPLKALRTILFACHFFCNVSLYSAAVAIQWNVQAHIVQSQLKNTCILIEKGELYFEEIPRAIRKLYSTGNFSAITI